MAPLRSGATIESPAKVRQRDGSLSSVESDLGEEEKELVQHLISNKTGKKFDPARRAKLYEHQVTKNQTKKGGKTKAEPTADETEHKSTFLAEFLTGAESEIRWQK